MHRCSDTSKFNSVRKTQMHQQGGNLKIKPRFCLVKIIHLEKLVWSQWSRMRHGKQKWRCTFAQQFGGPPDHSRISFRRHALHWQAQETYDGLNVHHFLSVALPVRVSLCGWICTQLQCTYYPSSSSSLLTFARHLTTSKTRDYDKLNPYHALQKAVIDHPCYPLT